MDEDKILAFVREHLAASPSMVTGLDQPLISSGIIDSFALVELSVFIEEELGARIPDPDMTVANFDTVRLAAATVGRFR